MDKQTIMTFDPGKQTGYAVFQDGKYVTSGVLKHPEDPCEAYVQEVVDLLDEYHPQFIGIEKMYTFTRKGKQTGKNLNMASIMEYAFYWKLLYHILIKAKDPVANIKIVDTKKLAKKKMAQSIAREITGKTRLSTHEAEAIAWGYYFVRSGDVVQKKFAKRRKR